MAQPFKMSKLDNLSLIIVLALAALTGFVWYLALFSRPIAEARIYFLDVGQGDAELLILPGGIKILTDAGPNQKILQSLQKVLPAGDRYIDIGVISHPQADHFTGFNYLLDNYKFGVFVFGGRSDSAGAGGWQTLLDKIKSQKIPLLTVSAGGGVKIGGNNISFLSPDNAYINSAELNDVGLVELIKTSSFRALLTSDTGVNIENYLIQKGVALKADILKVAHHGSKYSSGESFLEAVNPKVAVIEVGANNKYGHPTKDVLANLASVAAKIFRTDQNGSIEIFAENGKLKIFAEK
jgi:competence protein ComEC